MLKCTSQQSVVYMSIVYIMIIKHFVTSVWQFDWGPSRVGFTLELWFCIKWIEKLSCLIACHYWVAGIKDKSTGMRLCTGTKWDLNPQSYCLNVNLLPSHRITGVT